MYFSKRGQGLIATGNFSTSTRVQAKLGSKFILGWLGEDNLCIIRITAFVIKSWGVNVEMV